MQKYNNFNVKKPNAQQFFQTPKALYYDNELSKLSWIQKSFYSYLRNEACWSIKEGNYDEDGVYIEKTQAECCLIMNCSKNTMRQILSVLEDVGLIQRFIVEGQRVHRIYVKDCENAIDREVNSKKSVYLKARADQADALPARENTAVKSVKNDKPKVQNLNLEKETKGQKLNPLKGQKLNLNRDYTINYTHPLYTHQSFKHKNEIDGSIEEKKNEILKAIPNLRNSYSDPSLLDSALQALASVLVGKYDNMMPASLAEKRYNFHTSNGTNKNGIQNLINNCLLRFEIASKQTFIKSQDAYMPRVVITELSSTSNKNNGPLITFGSDFSKAPSEHDDLNLMMKELKAFELSKV